VQLNVKGTTKIKEKRPLVIKFVRGQKKVIDLCLENVAAGNQEKFFVV
jgi:hypothetical protein